MFISAKEEVKQIIIAKNEHKKLTGCREIIKQIFKDYNNIDNEVADIIYTAYQLGLKSDINVVRLAQNDFDRKKERKFMRFIEEVETHCPNIMRKSRKGETPFYRYAMYHITKGRYTLSELGRLMQQHHTTIIHGRQTAEDMLFTKDDTFVPIYKQVTEIFNRIYGQPNENKS